MKNGKIHICDTMDAIRRSFGKREYTVTFKSETVLDYAKQGNNYVYKTENVAEIATLLQTISDKNWALIDLAVNQSALEDMYVKLMEEKGEPMGARLIR